MKYVLPVLALLLFSASWKESRMVSIDKKVSGIDSLCHGFSGPDLQLGPGDSLYRAEFRDTLNGIVRYWRDHADCSNITLYKDGKGMIKYIHRYGNVE